MEKIKHNREELKSKDQGAIKKPSAAQSLINERISMKTETPSKLDIPSLEPGLLKRFGEMTELKTNSTTDAQITMEIAEIYHDLLNKAENKKITPDEWKSALDLFRDWLEPPAYNSYGERSKGEDKRSVTRLRILKLGGKNPPGGGRWEDYSQVK